MRSANGLTLVTASRLLEGVLPHRLQKTVSVPSCAILLAQDQTPVDQRGQALQHIDRAIPSIREYCLCRL